MPTHLMTDYTPLYCEENVWRLAERFPAGDVWVISNLTHTVALAKQKATADGWVVWDYHVVLAVNGRVHDPDTRLPQPCPMTRYVTETFSTQSMLPEEYRSLVRVLPAGEFSRLFFSDRSHMKRPDGTWLAPPPQWPAPVGPERTWRLSELLAMDVPSPGRVVPPSKLV
ncbi:MAG: hypothetical protein ACT4TC_10500 [Myxococcaceae bacterium]